VYIRLKHWMRSYCISIV